MKVSLPDDLPQNARLLGGQHPAEARVRKGLGVADEGDPLDLDHAAFDHLEDEIDAVVGPADDARRDAAGEPAAGS